MAGRRLRELRELGGQPLRCFEHEQLAAAQLSAGDELLVAAFASGRLMLAGRLRIARLEPSAGGALRAYGKPPFWIVDFSREVPHAQARALRFADGSALRFARESSYELHPAAILRPAPLGADSAASLADLAGPCLEHAPGAARPAAVAAAGPPALAESPQPPPASRPPDPPAGPPRGRGILRQAGERAIGRLRGLASRPGPASPPPPPAKPPPASDTSPGDALSVHRAGLSNRAAGALWRAGMRTIADVRGLVDELGAEALLAIPGIGHTSAMEVEELLGLRPSAGPAPDAPLDAETFIDASGLSVRSANALRRTGALTLGDVVAWTRPELAAIPNLGAMSVLEITDLLQRAGLTAASEPDALPRARPHSPAPRVPDARAEQMAEMRRAGATLAEIASRFDVSRERVRQILNSSGGPSARGASEARRAQQLKDAQGAAHALLDAFRAGADIADAASKLGLNSSAAQDIIQASATDRDRALRRGSSGRARAATAASYTNEQLADAVRGVAAQLGRTPTSQEYGAAAVRDRLPSLPTVAQRHGSWNAAVAAAGLQPTNLRRAYSRRWGEDACWTAARTAARENGGALPTVQRYEQMAADRPDLPSSATLRNRLGPWSSIGERIALDPDPPLAD